MDKNIDGNRPRYSMNSPHPTSRQVEMLDFIISYQAKNRISPTIREMQRVFNIESPNGIVCHLLALERKGFISRRDKTARSIVVLRRVDGTQVAGGGIPDRIGYLEAALTFVAAKAVSLSPHEVIKEIADKALSGEWEPPTE